MHGIVFGLERFHHYVFGRPITIETDHKRTCTEHHHALLRIQQYQVTVKYVPEKDIPLADALSRITPMQSSTIKGLDITVHELQSQLNASTTRLTQIREETANDDILVILPDTIAQGWTEKRKGTGTVTLCTSRYREVLSESQVICVLRLHQQTLRRRLKGAHIVRPTKHQQ